MKSIESLVKDNVRHLKPCPHGAEVYGAAQQTGRRITEILDFSSSVNPLGPSQKALDAAKAAFSEIAAYPDSNSNALREAIASRFAGITKDNLVMGNGSTELMYLFAEAFLKPGEKALMSAPTFGEYEAAVHKTGQQVKFVKLSSSLQVDAEAFKRELADAKIAFLCNPNNPTSKLIPQPVLTDVLETALQRDVLVFLDEDFLEFIDDEKERSMIYHLDRYPNLFVLRSFTKIFGLTGLRVGYGVTSKEIANVLLCAKIPWNINCLGQAAAAASLADEEHLAVTKALIQKEKAYLAEQLSKFQGFKFEFPDANFFFIDIHEAGVTAAALKQKMLSEGILIRDCASFRGLDEFYIRVAVKTHLENTHLIEAFKRALKSV
ncbi:MAG: histidinol-phosphate aminotransferase family protein [Candidatus Bathyarchaeota archaeon]|nr:histidinol-phosphate aminotransferase family protein [Candidatus Bathyarchaeota archaeon]